MTSTVDLGAALEAFILEHEYCGELDGGVEGDQSSPCATSSPTSPARATTTTARDRQTTIARCRVGSRMAWDIEMVDGCAVVRMNTNKVNMQNDRFFADLHGAFDRLERQWYRHYRETTLRVFQYPRPTVAAVNGARLKSRCARL